MEKSVNTNIKSKQISLHNQTWGEWEWREWIALSCSDYSSDHKNYNFLMIVIDLKNPISHLLAKLLSDSSISQSHSMLSFKSTSHNLGFNHHSNSVKYVRFSEYGFVITCMTTNRIGLQSVLLPLLITFKSKPETNASSCSFQNVRLVWRIKKWKRKNQERRESKATKSPKQIYLCFDRYWIVFR